MLAQLRLPRPRPWLIQVHKVLGLHRLIRQRDKRPREKNLRKGTRHAGRIKLAARMMKRYVSGKEVERLYGRPLSYRVNTLVHNAIQRLSCALDSVVIPLQSLDMSTPLPAGQSRYLHNVEFGKTNFDRRMRLARCPVRATFSHPEGVILLRCQVGSQHGRSISSLDTLFTMSYRWLIERICKLLHESSPLQLIGGTRSVAPGLSKIQGLVDLLPSSDHR